MEPKTTTNQEERQQVTNPQASELIQTATFGDLVGKETPAAQITAPEPLNILKGTNPYPDQGLAPVLRRPYIIDQFNWSGASAKGALLKTYEFPRDLFPENIEQKTNFEQFFRAATRLSIRIDATTWHQGALQISWCPHYYEGDNLHYQQTMESASNMPHSILSANTNTTVDIEIPYIAPSRYLNFRDTFDTAEGWFGKVFLHVRAPLRLQGDGTTPVLQVTVFGDYVNPEVAGETIRVSSLSKAEKVAQADDEQQMKTEAKSMAKSYARKKINPIKTKTVGALAEGMGALTGLLDVGMGFLADKPTDIQIPTKARQDSNSGLALMNGADCADWVAMDPQNKVTNDPSIYIEKRDYNLFSNYKLLPSLIFSGSWDGSNSAGDRIATIPVTPTFVTSYSQGDTVYYNTSHIANLASFFRVWRGSMKYHINFFTNKFTQGRVTVKWLPDPTITSTIANTEFGDVISHTVDISGDTSYSFEIPYLQESSWTPVLDPKEATEQPVIAWPGRNGQIVIQVMNKLITAEAEADPIVHFDIECSGGESFEVNEPKGAWKAIDGWADGTTTFAEMNRKMNKMDVKGPAEKQKIGAYRRQKFAQGEDGVTLSMNMRSLFEKPFPTLIPAQVTIAEQVSYGEQCSSFTQLLHRYTVSKPSVAISGADDPENYSPFVVLKGNITTMNRVLRTFHYKRGSFRNSINVVLLQSGQTWNLDGTTVKMFYDSNEDSYGSRGVVSVGTETRRWLEFAVPFQYIFDMACNSKYGYELSELPSAQLIAYRTDSLSASSISVNWWTAVGDDFTLGWPVNPMIWSWTAPETKNKQTNPKN